MAKKLRDQVMFDIEQFWGMIATQSDKDALMGPPPVDLTLFEYSNADFENGKCCGDTIALETIGRDLARQPARFPIPPEGNPSEDAFFRHAYVRFHVDEPGDRAILEFVFGPLFGRGYRYDAVFGVVISRAEIWVS